MGDFAGSCASSGFVRKIVHIHRADRSFKRFCTKNRTHSPSRSKFQTVLYEKSYTFTEPIGVSNGFVRKIVHIHRADRSFKRFCTKNRTHSPSRAKFQTVLYEKSYTFAEPSEVSNGFVRKIVHIRRNEPRFKQVERHIVHSGYQRRHLMRSGDIPPSCKLETEVVRTF